VPVDPLRLQSYLAQHIPIAGAMGVRVLESEPGRVVLEAPLEPSINHLRSAFGGSVASLATLAGWCLVHVQLREVELEADIVIQRSTIEFSAPAQADFKATCALADPDAWTRLCRAVTRHGRGRIHLDVSVEADGRRVGSFQGAYVALRP
jgi:thioesterase domain-containing protein